MSCLTSQEITDIKAEIAQLEAALTALDAAYLSSIGSSEIESYTFDSGEGRQQTKRRSPKEIRDEMSYIKAKLDQAKRRLTPGGGNKSLNLRRT